MEFSDLLLKEGISPKEVMVLRHRPTARKLRAVLPWLAVENHKAYNAYQQMQGPRVEKAMLKAKSVASFIGHEPGKALFIGLYNVRKATPLSHEDVWKRRAYVELVKKYGMNGMADKCATVLWFDLVRTDFFSDWQGKLVVSWPGKELSWWRWADRNKFLVHSIAEESLLDHGIPEWNQLTLTWDQLGVLPRTWRDELSRWRGIYLILDESDGKSYVGAAYGTENLLGRWLNYAKTGHGGNKKLKGRDAAKFRFSVLQVLPHDMDENEVQFIEKTWKDRLHTREFGLNDN